MLYKRTIPRICEGCAAPFLARLSSVNAGGGRFCGRSCSARFVPRVHPIRKPLDQRFWAKVDKNGPVPANRPDLGPCWIWTAARQPAGYGLIGVAGKIELAHRVSWGLAAGEALTRSDEMGHICDNPPCVRTDDEGFYEVDGLLLPRRGHLFKGTRMNNMRDRDSKGRGFIPPPMPLEKRARGERNGNAKLSNVQRAEIFARYSAGGVSQQALADEYGVHQTAISGVIIAMKQALIQQG